ncbi:MAG: hypothetical protein ACI4SS_07115 [Clostridia bacterium]
MANELYIHNDRVIISDETLNMTKEERRAEIARLEEEARKKRNFIRKTQVTTLNFLWSNKK